MRSYPSLDPGVARRPACEVWVAASMLPRDGPAPVEIGVGDAGSRDVGTAILMQVTAALLANPEAQVADVEVTNRAGVVTLKGQVNSPQVRERAGEIAARHPGVTSVINALEVRQ